MNRAAVVFIALLVVILLAALFHHQRLERCVTMTDETTPRIWCGACDTTLVDVASPGVTQDAEGYWIVRGSGVVDALNAHRAATRHDVYNFTMRVELSADEYDRFREAAFSCRIWSSPQRGPAD